jgi:hypothetical protein
MSPTNIFVRPVYYAVDACMNTIVQLPFRTASALFKLDAAIESMGGKALFSDNYPKAIKTDSVVATEKPFVNEKN